MGCSVGDAVEGARDTGVGAGLGVAVGGDVGGPGTQRARALHRWLGSQQTKGTPRQTPQNPPSPEQAGLGDAVGDPIGGGVVTTAIVGATVGAGGRGTGAIVGSVGWLVTPTVGAEVEVVIAVGVADRTHRKLRQPSESAPSDAPVLPTVVLLSPSSAQQLYVTFRQTPQKSPSRPHGGADVGGVVVGPTVVGGAVAGVGAAEVGAATQRAWTHAVCAGLQQEYVTFRQTPQNLPGSAHEGSVVGAGVCGGSVQRSCRQACRGSQQR